MAKIYQANHFTGQQLDEFMEKVHNKSLAGRGLTLDDQGVLHSTMPGYSTLLYSYVHTDNKEVYVQGLDLSTGVFTSASHGLSDNTRVFAVLHPPYHLGTPYNYLPGGLSLGNPGTNCAKQYYVSVVDENRFTLSESSGGVTVTFSEVSTMDLSKFHFEVFQRMELNIQNLPSFDSCLIVICGRVSEYYRYIRPTPTKLYSGKMGFASYDAANGGDVYGSVSVGNVGGFGSLYAEIECRILQPGQVLMVINEDQLSYDANNLAKAYHNRKYVHVYTDADAMTGVLFTASSGGQFINGTTVKIYAR